MIAIVCSAVALLALGCAVARRLSSAEFVNSALGITSADVERHWLLAVCASLLPDDERATWFATHVGYQHDLERRERRWFHANLVGTFPRYFVTSWHEYAPLRSERRSRWFQLPMLLALECTNAVSEAYDDLPVFLLPTRWLRTMHLKHGRVWIEERRGYVITRQVVKLRELPGHERFLWAALDSHKSDAFISGRLPFSFPEGRPDAGARSRRSVTIRTRRAFR
jgi:hypothetical protein